MPSFGFFACPDCIQNFRLRNWPIPNLEACAKVFIVCPDCKNTLEFFAFEIDIVRNGELGDSSVEILRTGPVERFPKDYRRDMRLKVQITRRQNLEQYGLLWGSMKRGSN
jgi:hypothetical protein